MSATGGSDFEAQILADLRRTHAQLKGAGRVQVDIPSTWSMRLTLEEVDVLLAAVDERDELRRQSVGDWEPDFPPVRVDVVGYVADRLIPDGALPSVAEVKLLPFEDALSRGFNVGREGCPRLGTIHACPLGGCPTFESNRETEIPDVPDIETYTCLVCDEAIEPRPAATPGDWRYRHVDRRAGANLNHPAIRAPRGPLTEAAARERDMLRAEYPSWRGVREWPSPCSGCGHTLHTLNGGPEKGVCGVILSDVCGVVVACSCGWSPTSKPTA